MPTQLTDLRAKSMSLAVKAMVALDNNGGLRCFGLPIEMEQNIQSTFADMEVHEAVVGRGLIAFIAAEKRQM